MTAGRPTPVTLALQGGGAHGAFTWGVLDRLLEDERLVIEGLSGTSAGAMNAAVLVDGWEKGGARGAREALHEFWHTMSVYGAFSPYRSLPGTPPNAEFSPFAAWMELLSQMASPYQLNPLNVNPLRHTLERTIDFERLRRCRSMRLYVSATNVRTNQLRVFTGEELSADALLASACLPQLHQAVEVEGEHYWDGGFTGNPVLEPLVSECESPDIVIVQINPQLRSTLPRTASEIMDRINEITFNATLMREIRAIADVTRLIEAGEVTDPRYQRTWFHLVAADESLEGLGVRSKLNAEWTFITHLRDAGRERAGAWLENHFEDLGRRSSLDLERWAPSYAAVAPAATRRAKRA